MQVFRVFKYGRIRSRLGHVVRWPPRPLRCSFVGKRQWPPRSLRACSSSSGKCGHSILRQMWPFPLFLSSLDISFFFFRTNYDLPRGQCLPEIESRSRCRSFSGIPNCWTRPPLSCVGAVAFSPTIRPATEHCRRGNTSIALALRNVTERFSRFSSSRDELFPQSILR